MKKQLSILLTAVLLSMGIFNTGFAENENPSDADNTDSPAEVYENEAEKSEVLSYTDEYGMTFNYEISYGNVKIIDISGSGEKIVIPEQIDNMPVTELLNRLSSNNKYNVTEIDIQAKLKSLPPHFAAMHTELMSITLPDTLEIISEGAFVTCKSLKIIRIPDSVTRIENSAFGSCRSLEDINIPDSVNYIGQQAFWGCHSLESINIPDSIECIYPRTFANTALKTVKLPSKLKYICESAFSGSEFESIDIPYGVESISQYAFYECTNLKEIKFPETLTFIGEFAFAHNHALTSVKLPSSLTTLQRCAFMSCYALEHINIPKGIAKTIKPAFPAARSLSDIDIECELTSEIYSAICQTPYWYNYIGNYTGDFLIAEDVLLKYTGSDKNPVIPESIKIIRQSAFTGSKISEIVIPSTVETVGSWAFAKISTLTKVTVQAGVKSIGEKAFWYCTGLTEDNVNIAEGVKVAADAFEDTPLDPNFIPESEYAHKQNESPKPEETPKPDSSPKPEQTPLPTPEPEQTSVMSVTSENGEVKVWVNDKEIVFPDAKPFIDENSRTQIPVRAVAEALGCKVYYDDETQLVTVTDKENIITLTIGSRTLTKNGTASQMDTEAIIFSDRTYIPARFIAEALGYKVKWN